MPADGEELTVSVKIDADDVVCGDFIGFGGEWDSRNYDAAGVTDEDFALIRKRVEWMRLPTARIMMLCSWCYKGGGTYDWESPAMRALYRHLDVCQDIEATVFLADWGCEAEWLHCPDVANVQDPKYAEIIGDYMDHLLNTKGYTCIQHFIMGNEPNYEVQHWDRWKAGILNVHAALVKHGLTDRVILTGTDHVDADDWHRMAVDQLSDKLGTYDFHCYADGWLIDENKLFEYCKKSWDYVRENDPNGATKPCIIGEAGLGEGAKHPYGNTNIDSVAYGIGMADYAVQAASAGSAAVFAWMLDDNSHEGFFWGMWTNKEKGLKLRPWFYVWSLLSRFFPQGSRTVRCTWSDEHVRVMAACGVDSKWTFCLVNRSAESRTLRLHVSDGARVTLDRYVFSNSKSKRDMDGFPIALDTLSVNLGAGADIVCDAESVVILTSMQ